MTFSMQRLTQSPVDCPSHSQAAIDRVAGETDEFCPLRNSVRLFSKRDTNIRPHIVLLLLGCGPAAILLAVRSVVVNSVQTKVGLIRGPHILVEIAKRTSPAITDNDTAPTVGRPFWASRIATSPYHRSPHCIQGMLRHSMRDNAGESKSPTGASATTHISSYKVRTSDKFSVPALTDALPVGMRVRSRAIFLHHSQFTKGPPQKIGYAVSAMTMYNAVRHAFSPTREPCLEQPTRGEIPTGCSHSMGRA